jgi:response regulator RpfG family c-di-GMP phosphodiesterase
MTAAANIAPLHKKAADTLLGAGVIKKEQYENVLGYMLRMRVRSEEAVIETGALSEADLLKALSAHYKTKFVTTERLAKADVSSEITTLVPRKVAETLAVFPLIYDAGKGELLVATADPDNLEVLNEVQLVAGVRDVKAIVARPAAVKAAISKAYANDPRPFAMLMPVGPPSAMGGAGANESFIEHTRQPTGHRMAAPQVSQPASAVQPAAQPAAAAKAPPPPTARRQTRPPPPLPAAAKKADPAPAQPAATEASIELMNVLVSLLENSRQDLRGHSAQVARLVRRLTERINLPRESVLACVRAAFIHDLGKMGQYHLTLFNASEYDGHKLAAQKSFEMPLRLLEAVHMSKESTDGVRHMYERYDGKGFPDGLAGKEIPLASRVLALVDTYVDLTQNPRNPMRKALLPADAFIVLEKFRDTVFDPHLIDLFKTTMMGEDVRARLLANRYTALIVDADPEETTVLELRMIEQGFEVKIARSVADALKVLSAGEIDLVVSEVDMPNGDGLALLGDARKQPWGKDVPWVIHTRRQGRAEAQRAFDLGVLDFASKLAPSDVLVAKLKSMLDQRVAGKQPRGVSGSLAEMSLPDMIQVLWTARKTGNLKIRSGTDVGEIHLSDGQVVDAVWCKARGEDAFFQMLKLRQGDFGLDPAFRPTKRVIQQSSETLLLEGMRRLDEGIV